MNEVETIDKAIHSVVAQAGNFRIRFHVQDGGSHDGTLDKIIAWKRAISTGRFATHCHSVDLSYASEADSGMYEALVRGFDRFAPSEGSFMTWINADDLLMPGALSLAAHCENQFSPNDMSWFGGTVHIVVNDMTTRSFDRPIPTGALRLGLCDGEHWSFLQQEGVFFRKWLWDKVDPDETVGQKKLAGDWNLWRRMAHEADFAQVPFALGGFRLSDGQLSNCQRDDYVAEINDVLPLQERRRRMKTFCESDAIIRKSLKSTDFRRAELSIHEEHKGQLATFHCRRVFGDARYRPTRPAPSQNEAAGGSARKSCERVEATNCQREIADLVRTAPGVIALDSDWQFPAITEKHAFERMAAQPTRIPADTLYVAYPWATLIDKLQTNAVDRDVHLARFEQFCSYLGAGKSKITVCQHIHARRYWHLFQRAGITDVFWSHATPTDVEAANNHESDVRFRPFPLYPVQVPEGIPEAEAESRPCLFSFVGARANEYYLTPTRNWILDLLGEDNRGVVTGRDTWHYQEVVYDQQVHRRRSNVPAEQLVNKSQAKEFVELLKDSVFSLCPSGTGPNSIRLWESIGAGAIPVVLSDNWMPPGNSKLWEMGVVYCEERRESIRSLPDKLAELAADPSELAAKRHALRQLWLLYGPKNFVADVHEHLLGMASARGWCPGKTQSNIALTEEDHRYALLKYASGLLTEPTKTLEGLAVDPGCGAKVASAREALDAGSELVTHFDAVLAHAERKTRVKAPAMNRGARPRVCLFGQHSNRTPISYPSIRRMIEARIEFVDNPEDADCVITGFNVDLKQNAQRLLRLQDNRRTTCIAVLSEEPLWDVTWSGGGAGREGRLCVEEGSIAYTFIGHETSDIYEFERIPYFVLTSDKYSARYAALMKRFERKTGNAMIRHWDDAPVTAAFFAEYRRGEAYSGEFRERDIARLSAFRTELAEAMPSAGVLRVGKGWGTEVPRQKLPDWHLDKLAQLDRRTKLVSGVENVHQKNYITEKIFDSFAVGGIPIYWGRPGTHRVFDLVPAEAMINVQGLEVATAARKIAEFVPDSAFAEAWVHTCRELCSLFEDVATVEAERRRVAEQVLGEILTVVEHHSVR